MSTLHTFTPESSKETELIHEGVRFMLIHNGHYQTCRYDAYPELLAAERAGFVTLESHTTGLYTFRLNAPLSARADRLRNLLGTRQEAFGVEMHVIKRAYAQAAAIVRIEAENAIARRYARYTPIPLEERVRTEYEIQQAELLMSELEIAYTR